MKKIIFCISLMFFVIQFYAQNITISGYIEDSESGERLIGANIFDASNTKYGTASNSFGFYSLTLPKGVHKITVSYIGYGFWQKEMNITKDTSFDVQISTEVKLQQVVVSAAHNQVESSQMSRVDVPIQSIKLLPAIFGEVDVLKALQLLPGVQGGTEGTSGIYVRGGGPDQNLILLDGVPVYNANHLFGFFSVFNADAISNVSLYKGGFPARYGGRLSSVIDIHLKEGNTKKLTGSVAIGLISSKFTLEGPIVKDKTSFIISARRTYIDVIAAPFIALAQKVNNPGDPLTFRAGYYFYDFNAKINHKISDKDRIYFSIYGGQDKAYTNIVDKYEKDVSKAEMVLGWGNIISALRWNHVLGPKLFGNLIFTYSQFNYFNELSMEETSYDVSNNKDVLKYSINSNSGINDWAGKLDFDYSLNNNHKMKFGATAIYHTFHPGTTQIFLQSNEFTLDTTNGDKALSAYEYAVYAEDDVRIGNKIKINVGGRLSAFKVRDTLYLSPEPRISGRILLTDKWSLKLSYAEMKQYLHFLTNNTIGMPNDLWLPATDLVVPQKSIQYAAGSSFSVTDKLSLVIEGFYKDMYNLVELKEGESIFGDLSSGSAIGQIWETKVTQGRGWSYGAEILLKKDLGRLTGWIAYTLSWSNRKFDDISFGNVFPYRYDRRHDLSVVGIYKLNDNWNFGMTFVYSSGNPITLAQLDFIPLSDAFNQNYGYDSRINYFSQRNNYRLPAYNRLDLSANWTKNNKLGKRTWSFGVYNVYNHLNPFFVDIEKYNTDNKLKLNIYSIFPIMPSISYKLEF